MSPTFDAQAAFVQVTGPLDARRTSQQQTQQILRQAVDIRVGMLGSLRRMQTTQAEMQGDIRQLQDSRLTLLRGQNGMLDYMKFTFGQQAKWDEQQNQLNSVFLHELRAIRRDMRHRDDDAQAMQNKIYQKIEGRIGRLEDFMNDQLRKAS